MLNEKEVAGKLKALADSTVLCAMDIKALAAEFRTLMEHKEYAKAKNRYDTALNIAVALELPEHTKEELFGKRDDSGHLTENGLFSHELVQKAYYMVAVKGQETG